MYFSIYTHLHKHTCTCVLTYSHIHNNAHTNWQAHASALSSENEQLKLQVAEMAIIAQIKRGGDSGQDSSEAVLEKYYEAKRELETLKQRVGSEYEDEIERLTAAKKSLEKKVGVARLAFMVDMVQ